MGRRGAGISSICVKNTGSRILQKLRTEGRHVIAATLLLSSFAYPKEAHIKALYTDSLESNLGKLHRVHVPNQYTTLYDTAFDADKIGSNGNCTTTELDF